MNELGRFEDAVTASRRVLSLSPDLAQAHYNCGLALFRLGKVREALEGFNRAIQFKPDYAKAFCNRGTAFYKLGEMDKAVKDFTRAVDLQPGEAEGYHNLGNIFKDMGNLDRARENLVTANRLDPANPFINRGLSNLKTFTPDDPQIETMKALLQEEKSGTEARVQLCFALAKAFDDIGDYDSGFSYLKEGNRLRKHFLGYDISSDLDWFEKIRQMFDSGMPSAPGEQDAGPRMIFIVGMPRSGTSLVEQVLASHTMVFGAGEVGALSTLSKSILAKHPVPAGKGAAVPLTEDEIRGLRQGYFDRLAGLGFSEQVVTDKMPVNFQFIGFMVAAFPGVKIVHLNRDPMATCWSNFKHYFSSSGNGYAYDLDDLAEFFKAYKELMAFWQKRFPDHIYELNYEALTENQEEETRRLLSFCGLPWEEGCLEFHKNRRVVRTASSGQVRKKIYQGSSKVWKNYAHQLKDMASALALQ